MLTTNGSATIDVSELQSRTKAVLDRVANGGASVVVADSGVAIAAVIPIGEYERMLWQEVRDSERLKPFLPIAEAFRDVSDEEIEREVARALEAIRGPAEDDADATNAA